MALKTALGLGRIEGETNVGRDEDQAMPPRETAICGSRTVSYLKRQAALSRLSLEELVARQTALKADPTNANRNPRSIYLYTPATHRKLDDIAWAITYKLAAKRCEQPEGSAS